MLANIQDEIESRFLATALPVLHGTKYKIAKETFDQIIDDLDFNRRKTDLYFGDWSVMKMLWDYYFEKLSDRYGVVADELDDWLKREMQLSKRELFAILQEERTRIERRQIIEECLVDILNDYLKENYDAEK